METMSKPGRRPRGPELIEAAGTCGAGGGVLDRGKATHPARARVQKRRFDVCNGDADGLCAVRQWRLHEPAESTLVTGLKREIELLARVDARGGDDVLVCDIALSRNRSALLRLLDAGVRVRYFDHHTPGPPVVHPAFESFIDTSPQVCSSLIVNRVLEGRFRRWAIVGAFGDNLGRAAEHLGAEEGLHEGQLDRLRLMGEAINYNAYGDDERDVTIAPATLYPRMAAYDDPLEMFAREPLLHEIDARRQDDLALAARVPPYWEDARGSVLLLPAVAWSRRVIGSFGNVLARRQPRHAHALLVPDAVGNWRVSVRAPLEAPAGAEELCLRFGGAGRAAAAGIDHLPASRLEAFVRAFAAARWNGRW